MSDTELQAMSAELSTDDDPIDAPADDDAPADGDQQQAPADFDQAAMAQVCAVLVSALGGAICTRADVSPLTDQETAALAGAIANIAAQYDFTMSPKTAAWIGLAVTVAGVALPRQQEIEARKKALQKDPEPVQDDAPVRSVADVQAELDARAEAA